MLRIDTYPFKLKELPYSYNALEGIISEETMKIHHNKHLKNYIDKLNLILEKYPKYQNWTLEEILRNIYSFPADIQTDIRNNAGGVFNHELYFDIINPKREGKEPINILKAVDIKYMNIQNFISQFKMKANSVFGSGYVFLVLNKKNELDLLITKNQESVYELNLYPLMLIDLWEHAYYLDYQNRRSEYIDNFIKIINLERVEERYINYIKNLE